MKARLISVLLVIALLVTVGVVAAQAAEETGKPDFGQADYAAAVAMDFSNGNSYKCPICGSNKTWTAISGEKTSLSAGHYYLSDNVTAPSSGISVSGVVCINLNGKTISGNGSKVFATGSSSSTALNIMGLGDVKNTTDNYVINGSCGSIRLLGGTYSSIANAETPLIYVTGAGLRRVYVFEGAVVNGTIKAQYQSGNYGPSIYMHGGYIKRVELGSLDARGYTGRDGSELTGSPIIDELVIPEGRAVSISGLTEGASICVVEAEVGAQITKKYAATGDTYDGKNGALTSARSDENVSDFAQYFRTTPGYQVKVSEDKSYLIYDVSDEAEPCEFCGRPFDGNWSPVGKDFTGGTLEAGHYQLTEDLELATALVVNDNACIDLNGHNITSAGRVLEQSGGKLYLVGTTCTITGKATADPAATVHITGGELILKTGTFKHEVSTLPSFYVQGGTLEINDGVILTADRGDDDTTVEDDVRGNNVVIGSSGVVNMNGGVIENGTVIANGTYRGGANVLLLTDSSQFHMTGGEIRNGVVSTKENSYGGGNILLHKGLLTVNGGTIKDGYSQGQGGNILTIQGAMELQNATVTGGTGRVGGNICIRNAFKELSNRADVGIYIGKCTISDGTATGTATDAADAIGGGNIAYFGGTNIAKDGDPAEYLYFKLYDTTLDNGKAEKGYGGNLLISPSGASRVYATLFGPAVLKNGDAKFGGNLAVNNTGRSEVDLVAVNMSAGTARHGALAYVENANAQLATYSGTFDSTACTITDKGNGKGLYLRSGELALCGGTFKSDSSAKEGEAVYVGLSNTTGTLTFHNGLNGWPSGALNIQDGAKEKAIAINNSDCKLKIDTTNDNEVFVYFKDSRIGADGIIANGESNGAWTKDIKVANIVGTPAIEYKEGQLYVPTGKVADEWVNAQEKINAGEAVVVHGGVLNLTNNAAMQLAEGASVRAELNGYNANVTLAEGAAAAIFRATNNNIEKASKVTLAEGITTNSTAWNAAGYYNVVMPVNGEANAYTYHKLEMAMKNISLRIGDVGLYYTSEIKADETLAAMINSAGVLLGATNEGGVGGMADLMLKAKASDLDKTDGAFRGVGIENPDLSEVTSVLVKNIFKAGATNNAERGKIRIVGTPYVKFVTGDVLVCQDVVDYSMKLFLEDADVKITDQTKLGALKTFCDTWNVASFGWTLHNILGTAPAEPEV